MIVSTTVAAVRTELGRFETCFEIRINKFLTILWVTESEKSKMDSCFFWLISEDGIRKIRIKEFLHMLRQL